MVNLFEYVCSDVFVLIIIFFIPITIRRKSVLLKTVNAVWRVMFIAKNHNLTLRNDRLFCDKKKNQWMPPIINSLPVNLTKLHTKNVYALHLLTYCYCRFFQIVLPIVMKKPKFYCIIIHMYEYDYRDEWWHLHETFLTFESKERHNSQYVNTTKWYFIIKHINKKKISTLCKNFNNRLRVTIKNIIPYFLKWNK